MIVNLRSKLYTFRKLDERRKRLCVGWDGRATAPAFTAGEYKRLCQTHGVGWVQEEQVRRRAEMWTPDQERTWRALRRELGWIVR